MVMNNKVILKFRSENDHVYEHTPNPPLEYQEGDILGLYQRGGGNHMRVYYQETTGPENYWNPDELNVEPPASDILNLTILASTYIS